MKEKKERKSIKKNNNKNKLLTNTCFYETTQPILPNLVVVLSYSTVNSAST